MSLRAQLLVFGLLTLALPWAGYGFVEQMEGALRQGLESSLRASASTAATVLGNDPALDFGPDDPAAATLYAHRLDRPPGIDGYRSDWRLARRDSTPGPAAAIPLGDGKSAWLGIDGRFVYLHIEVAADELVYPAEPGAAPFGDRVVVLTGGAEGVAVLLSTSAPGRFRAQRTRPGRFAPTGGYEDRVVAAWQETAAGYSVEARLPADLLGGAIGIAVIDVDPAERNSFAVAVAATWSDDEPAPSRIVTESTALQAALGRIGRAGDRLRVTDRAGWLLADSGDFGMADGTAGAAATPGVSERILRAVLRRNDPLYDGLEAPLGRISAAALTGALAGTARTAWYRRGPANEAVVATAVPIPVAGHVAGMLVLEQASDPVLTLSNQARMRLMASTLLVSLGAAALLFGYASFLSWRIGRLARAAETALSPSGDLNTGLPGYRARDEIGALSRSFADLLNRLAAYTEYLRTLTGKLAHEIRTPVAIVTSSADNLREAPDESEVYLERMRQGTNRLNAILAAMSEATRIEQAVANSPAESYDPVRVLVGCTEAYRTVYPERLFDVAVPPAPLTVYGSGDLLAQLLDKLVDNAVGFSPAGSTIRIAAVCTNGALELAIANDGPPLPESMRHQLFDSLVSIRDAADGGSHLGLGLYIVALVARFHGGSVAARNRPDATGAEFVVRIPLAAPHG